MFEPIKRWRLGKQYGYETLFKNQDRTPAGKTGVILADMGMPEAYEPEFYIGYIHHVFHYMLPKFLHRVVLADRGIALVDPENALAREPFEPRQLIDMHGSFTNREGRPYTECEATWRPPGMKKNPWDNGYFLYTAEGKGGAPDICQKTGAKVIGWYYGHLLPEQKVAWAYQCGKVYDEATAALQKRFPEAVFRHARYVYRDSMHQAVEELLDEGCETVVYQCFCNPVYSDFEEYAYALPMIHEFVAGRAKVICADQLGNQPAMREGYVQMIRDQMAQLPTDARVLLILSKHGHPFKKETQDARGPEYRRPLEAAARRAMEDWGGTWDLVWSNDEYADEYWDPDNNKAETHAAYRQAIDEGYDYALEIPTDFMAENTDLMIFHAMKKFDAFAEYDRNAPIPYPDWDQPLVRTFHEGKTTGIYAGCPVGPYRKYVVEAVEASVSEVLAAG
ncbi:MAG: ferrochelatase [Anaerolineae bacterium]|nr:ferrochelatase [Anaerolineae bacterium]